MVSSLVEADEFLRSGYSLDEWESLAAPKKQFPDSNEPGIAIGPPSRKSNVLSGRRFLAKRSGSSSIWRAL